VQKVGDKLQQAALLHQWLLPSNPEVARLQHQAVMQRQQQQHQPGLS
jgi:hypothetical protein